MFAREPKRRKLHRIAVSGPLRCNRLTKRAGDFGSGEDAVSQDSAFRFSRLLLFDVLRGVSIMRAAISTASGRAQPAPVMAVPSLVPLPPTAAANPVGGSPNFGDETRVRIARASGNVVSF
jgi:hypothetical protein